MTSFLNELKEKFQEIYKLIDRCLDEDFNYFRLVFTFNPQYFADPKILPQAWLRKETLTLMMFSSRFHALVIGPPGIGKTSIASFLERIGFPYKRATLIRTESGGTTTTAGLRDTIIELSDLVIKEFEDEHDKSWIPSGILHLEEYLRAPARDRDLLKSVMVERMIYLQFSRRYKEIYGIPDSRYTPVNVYADTNPPKADYWLSKDFNTKKEQLEPLLAETANLRRFTVILVCDDYKPEQKAIINKYKEFWMVNPHPAIESGEFYEKYGKFVFKRRRIKVKRTPIPDYIIYFFVGLERLQKEGKLLLPIVFGDYVEKIYGIAEAFARINGHNEITDTDWTHTMLYYQRVVESLMDSTYKSSKDYIYQAAKLGEEIIERISTKIKETFLRRVREEIEEKTGIDQQP